MSRGLKIYSALMCYGLFCFLVEIFERFARLSMIRDEIERGALAMYWLTELALCLLLFGALYYTVKHGIPRFRAVFMLVGMGIGIFLMFSAAAEIDLGKATPFSPFKALGGIILLFSPVITFLVKRELDERWYRYLEEMERKERYRRYRRYDSCAYR